MILKVTKREYLRLLNALWLAESWLESAAGSCPLYPSKDDSRLAKEERHGSKRMRALADKLREAAR